MTLAILVFDISVDNKISVPLIDAPLPGFGYSFILA